eukprot:8005221-Pyramimonas_sp.AAC.1
MDSSHDDGCGSCRPRSRECGVGVDVGLEDVKLSSWPCYSLEVCLAELAGGRDVELAVVLDVLDGVE